MGDGRRVSLTIALALACFAGLAQPAAAVEVVPISFAWGVVDETGVDNNVVISQVGPDKIRVTDTAGVTFVGGCVAEGPQAAVCDIQLPLVADSFFNMGGGTDSLTITSFPFLGRANGGPGDDSLSAPAPSPIPSLPSTPLSVIELNGEEGNDLLIGTTGPDRIQGGPGDDLCLGDIGKDVCRGALGDDRCDTGGGDDTCVGAKGRDSCVMGSGADLCNGGKGRDRCDGGAGSKDLERDCERSRRFEKVDD